MTASALRSPERSVVAESRREHLLGLERRQIPPADALVEQGLHAAERAADRAVVLLLEAHRDARTPRPRTRSRRP